jgi:hypothetical protein
MEVEEGVEIMEAEGEIAVEKEIMVEEEIIEIEFKMH